MTSQRTLESRIRNLERPSDPTDLPRGSLCLILSAGEVIEGDHENVVLLDGQPHYVPNAVRDVLKEMAERIERLEESDK